METLYKNKFLRVKYQNLSCISPEDYGKRFQTYIENRVFKEDDETIRMR